MLASLFKPTIGKSTAMFWTGDRTNRSDESVRFSFYGFEKIFAYLWRIKDRKEKIICPLCRVTSNRMNKSQEEDEFIAVRVQDPRVQNEGSWNSYVDFKIFLHTNSKAFTAKTSCVRRRYSEFVWLKRKLQKNAGLVPVPDLPKKSYFSFVNDDFIERRRKGLQSFLDRVVHMTVCLSDSQLHLFLQTQLPVKHIEDCVQGHTPYTVTEAILNYASSNRGWVQEEGGVTEELWMAPVPYESTDSPAHHLPSIQYAVATSSRLHPPSELTDVSDLETVSRLSGSEQTGSDLKQGSEPEQKVQEEETQRLDDDEVSDLQRDGCEYQVQQIEVPFEVKHMQEDLDKAQEQDMSVGEGITSVFEKRTLGGTGEEKKGRQEAAFQQESTVSTKDVTKEDAVVKVHNNEAILDQSAAQKDNAEEGDLEEAADKTWEAVALDEASTSEENISNTKQQEQSKAEKTQKRAIQENGVIQKEQVNEREISETYLSDSESSGFLVGEVNKINAKCVNTDSAILILEGIEEALVTQTAPMTETVQDVSFEISNEDLNANTADVNTLVLQAIEVDSMQCHEKDSHIITAQQPDAN